MTSPTQKVKKVVILRDFWKVYLRLTKTDRVVNSRQRGKDDVRVQIRRGRGKGISEWC